MKTVTIPVIFAFILALPGATWAQEPPPEADKLAVVDSTAPAGPDIAEAPGETSESPAVVPLKKGAPAPFLGLLVPEARFVELLEAENKARELAAKLKAAERTAELVEQVYLSNLEKASIVAWYDSPSLNRWVGIILGGAIAGLSIWGASELNKKREQ